MNRWKEKSRRAFEAISDLIFPRRCAVCDRPVDRLGQGVCLKCKSQIQYIKAPFCMKCGKQLNEPQQEYCNDCLRRKHFYLQGKALYDYGSMADSIFRFKYMGRQEYAGFYGKELYDRYGFWLRAVRPDALVPVPIHASRKRKRGYNQAELLAAELSKYSGLPVNSKLIIRKKKTKPQKDLTTQERQNNLKKAFKICQNDVKLSTIVIIDDIYTTGSTIDDMAKLLMASGIQKVYYVALAVGRGI